MNISLNVASSKKAKTKSNANANASLGFGLNARHNQQQDPTKQQQRPKNVFEDDDDDDDDDDEDSANETNRPISERDRVNRQIAKEQAALRQRAQAAMAAASTLDYDGVYDSFHPDTKDEPTATAAAPPPPAKKSRYIEDLLQTAQQRQRERELILERKIAKEQALEDAEQQAQNNNNNPDWQSKEKFITKAYRRKLEERNQWQIQETQRQEEERAEETRKQQSGGTAAWTSFYGNLSRNVALGGKGGGGKGGDGKEEEEEHAQANQDSDEHLANAKAKNDDSSTPGHGLGFTASFETSQHVQGESDDENDDPSLDTNTKEPNGSRLATMSESIKSKIPPMSPSMMRELREKKVAEARLRYLKRKQDALQQ